MHLHNRAVEKIIAILLKKGYHKQASREDKDSYIKAIKITMDTCVLGLEYNETNWKVLLNETKIDVSSSISFMDGYAVQTGNFIYSFVIG